MPALLIGDDASWQEADLPDVLWPACISFDFVALKE
jgi:hypothetical protein